MRFRSARHALLWALVAGVGILAPAARGQEVAIGGRSPSCPSVPCPTPAEVRPPDVKPSETPTAPASPVEPTLAPEQFAATGGGEMFAAASSAVGYVDPAIPVTRLRIRADAAYDSNRPDRAEFFYPKCGCFALAGIDPNAKGPPLPETRLNYQELLTYMEWAPSQRFSSFLELPVRFVNPEVNANEQGFGDMNFGLKYAFLYSTERVATVQLRTYVPTGDSELGLGTNHVSLEPAVLVFQKLNDRMSLEAEFRDWIPVGGTDFAGNVIRYGAGVNYMVYNGPSVRVAPVVELVGWTVLSGKESGDGGINNAAGDTIVNAKVGVRTGFGGMASNGMMSRSDLYLGYGRALTGDVWYKDVMRLEFRLNY